MAEPQSKNQPQEPESGSNDQRQRTTARPEQRVTRPRLLFTFLLGLGPVLAALLVVLFIVTDPENWTEVRLLLLVMLAGALGAYVHAATSFTSYVGNRSLLRSWTFWYYLRPLIGMVLALMVYFGVRGGFLALTADGGNQTLDPFGIAALAALTGMFSKQATDKLREVFDNLFRTASGAGDAERKDKLGEARPVEEIMIPRDEIVAFEMEPGTDKDQVALSALHELLGGRVTRVPVLDSDGRVQCVIHQSLLYRYVAERALSGRTDDLQTLTLGQFLEDKRLRALVSEALAFVAPESTLAEAKRRMEETPGCQDVLVTEDGTRNTPVKGWLTNVDISRHLGA